MKTVEKRKAACHAAFMRRKFADASCSPSVCKAADEREIRRGIPAEAVAQFRFTGKRKEDAAILAAVMKPERKFRVYTNAERVAESVAAFKRISFPKTMAA